LLCVSYIREGVKSEVVRKLAGDLARPEDMFYFVRDYIHYAPDPFDIWKLPEQTLRDRMGDCEDKAMLLASMLIAEGYDAYCRVARIQAPTGEIGDHMWVALRRGTGWVELDPSCIDCGFGEIKFKVVRNIMSFNDKVILVIDPVLAEKYVIH